MKRETKPTTEDEQTQENSAANTITEVKIPITLLQGVIEAISTASHTRPWVDVARLINELTIRLPIDK